MMIILHNKFSKSSRNFIATYGAGNDVIDWYEHGNEVSQYIVDKLPPPSQFPCIVDRTEKAKVDKATTPNELDEAVKVHKIRKIVSQYSLAGKTYTDIENELSLSASEKNLAKIFMDEEIAMKGG